jgi:hypothetical protein
VVWCRAGCGVVCQGVLRQRLATGTMGQGCGREVTLPCCCHCAVAVAGSQQGALCCISDAGTCLRVPIPLHPTVKVGRNVVHGSDSVENGERETGAPPPAACHPPVDLRSVAWQAWYNCPVLCWW